MFEIPSSSTFSVNFNRYQLYFKRRFKCNLNIQDLASVCFELESLNIKWVCESLTSMKLEMKLRAIKEDKSAESVGVRVSN